MTKDTLHGWHCGYATRFGHIQEPEHGLGGLENLPKVVSTQITVEALRGKSPQEPFPPTANQTFRDGVGHKTKAHAIAKSAHHPVILKQKQQLEKTVLNLRSQEVSRETARKTPEFVRYDICGVVEVRRFQQKTPQNMAFSGVFIFAAESLQPVSWRRRRDSNP
ncbi:MAG: hypothetical protein JNK99_01345 [Candidatus Accumulibacter sp.]|uniref:hypothetical protein n=1 Tax=Accumulibacter sp. TaxID=2053492 RepID=UPI001A522E28|nr:hypothetical protein [Accumulibacter sp.]MBL8393384.1 hypothetical protein [Accumulibacter sp.]